MMTTQKYEEDPQRRQPLKWRQPKKEDDPENEDDSKFEDEDDLRWRQPQEWGMKYNKIKPNENKLSWAVPSSGLHKLS